MTAPILAGIAMVRGPHFEACDGMTCYWIYDLPNWKLGLLIVSIIVSGSILGYLVSRRTVRKLLGSSDRYNDVVSWVFTGVGVFYGLALGLIAVATWENYSDIDAHASKEAALIGALFDNLDGYGPPYQAALEGQLRAYTRFIIERDWPAHRQGRVDEEGTRLLSRFEDTVMRIEPGSDRVKLVHGQVISDLNQVDDARGLRLSSVTAGLPAVLWAVVLIGGVLNIMLLYLFWIENRTLHLTLIGLYSGFIALLIFLTAAMDNPYRGEFSVSPDTFRDVLEKRMGASSLDKG